jgi:hypothetical protein
MGEAGKTGLALPILSIGSQGNKCDAANLAAHGPQIDFCFGPVYPKHRRKNSQNAKLDRCGAKQGRAKSRIRRKRRAGRVGN